MARTETPQNELLAALSTLHLGGKYSDLTVVCGSKRWAVHKAILCSRSGFFDGACSNQFRESQTGLIDLSEDDEEAIEHMIHYFYHLDYLTDEADEEPSAVFRHRQISDARRTLPKKLDLSQIQDPLLAQFAACAPSDPPTPPSERPSSPQARHDSLTPFDKAPRSPKFKTRARSGSMTSPRSASGSDTESDCEEYEEYEYETDDSNLLTHTRVYALAEKYDIPTLKELAKRKFEMAMACYYDSPEFADAIEEVYCSTIDTDRGLRDVVLQAFRSHPQLASTQDVFAVIKETPSLAFELWKVERGIPV
ncbi:hypothetical protein H2203_004806 [Taxawa tesnikishii (nom. ined.)]|nr:hypothetical protein H2203_004806 [Dothideales sp. JES 119]